MIRSIIMAREIAELLDSRIAELESQVTALRRARAALVGSAPRHGQTSVSRKQTPGRRKFTAAQRAEISRRMKATWAKRKAAGRKSLKRRD